MLKAFDSKKTKGRIPYDEELLVHDLGPFLSDYLKILQSKSYRRLAYKTQVLCFPENPHIRTRGVHTNEVVAISTAISEMLNLNTYLCQAIAAGHDIGHTPYGHFGERTLTELTGKEFKHNIFSVIVAQEIERKGKGLNLSYETLEGILSHSRGGNKLERNQDKPEEYSVVMYSDKIAYTFSDLNDAVRYNLLDEKNMPVPIDELGPTQRVRNDSCARALIRESKEKGHVSFSEGKEFDIFNNLKNFMYEEFYSKIDFKMHETILKRAYDFFSSKIKDIDPALLVALLTDREANFFGKFLLNTRKPDLRDIRHFGIFEILPYLKDKKIDYTDPNLGKI